MPRVQPSGGFDIGSDDVLGFLERYLMPLLRPGAGEGAGTGEGDPGPAGVGEGGGVGTTGNSDASAAAAAEGTSVGPVGGTPMGSTGEPTATDPSEHGGIGPPGSPAPVGVSVADEPTANVRVAPVTPYGLATNRGGLAAAARGAVNPSSAGILGAAASAIGAALGVPGMGAAVGAGVGAANNAISNHASDMFGTSNPSPGQMAIAAADIADQVSGVQGAATSTGVGQGGVDTANAGAPGEMQQAESLRQTGQRLSRVLRPGNGFQVPGTNVSPIFRSPYTGMEESPGLAYDDQRRRPGGFGVGV